MAIAARDNERKRKQENYGGHETQTQMTVEFTKLHNSQNTFLIYIALGFNNLFLF